MAQLTHPRSPLWPVDPRSLPSVEEQTAECECEQTERLESCTGTFFLIPQLTPAAPTCGFGMSLQWEPEYLEMKVTLQAEGLLFFF